MKCFNCGHENPDENKFCSQCGSRLSSSENEESDEQLADRINDKRIDALLDEPELKIIDVFVCKLRKKLMEALDGKCYIETIWGRGYTIKDPAEEEEESELSDKISFERLSQAL